MKHHKSSLVQGQYLALGAGVLLLSFLGPLKAQSVRPSANPYPQAQPQPVGNYYPQDSLTQQTSPCRQLGKKDTVVIIEASNSDRMQKVNQVVSQHNLRGDFCTSRRTGRIVWMSQQLANVDTAVKVFDYFRSVGLISPVNPYGSGDSLRNGAFSPSPRPGFQSPGNPGSSNSAPSNQLPRPQYGNYGAF